MFNKKQDAQAASAAVAPPLYKVVYIPSGAAAVPALNTAADNGAYRFLEWFDDKWERNGYAGTVQRQAIYIKV